jgi:hypothetical protein
VEAVGYECCKYDGVNSEEKGEILCGVVNCVGTGHVDVGFD